MPQFHGKPVQMQKHPVSPLARCYRYFRPSNVINNSPRENRRRLFLSSPSCRSALSLRHPNLQGRVGGRAPRVLGDASLETVLELAGDGAEVPHATSAGGLSALGLLGPVVYIMLVWTFGNLLRRLIWDSLSQSGRM